MPDIVGIASGTLVKLGDTAGTVFTNIGELLRLGDISQERPLVDATRLAAVTREYVAGLKEGAEVELEMRMKMDDAQQDATTGLQSVYNSGASRLFQVKWPNQAMGIEFGAIVIATVFAGNAPGELLRRTFRLKMVTDVTVKAIT